MMLTAGCKRSALLEEDLLFLDAQDVKRFRLDDDEDDVALPVEVEEALASAVAAATSSSSSGDDAASRIASAAAAIARGGRRRQHDDMDDACEADGAHADKRQRHTDCRSESDVMQSWAEQLVKALQGCPSVDEAMRRCSRILSEFSSETRQSVLRDLQQEDGPLPEASDDSPGRPGDDDRKNLQQLTKALKRAIVYLVQRCRRLETEAQEKEALQRALAESKEAHSRLLHSNEVLRGHLRVQMDSQRNMLQPYSCP